MPSSRVWNFSAGPSTLPVDVIIEAQRDLLNYGGSGMGVMEMSHRSPVFEGILADAIRDLRDLLAIPLNYHVLFLQGGASLQFAMIPGAFARADRPPTYLVTGAWGEKAVESARLTGPVAIGWDGKAGGYRTVPSEVSVSEGSYLHFTSNETIGGVQFDHPPVGEDLVCDMSSDILSRPIEVERYALIYAGVQKNLGPAGATLVVVRDDFLARHREGLAPMLDYRVHVKNNSLYNTPSTWSIYICGLVLRYLKQNGGIASAQRAATVRSEAIYRVIDASEGFFRGHAEPSARSQMNVVFTLPSEDLTSTFLEEAQALGFDGLKGHRSVGGCRASMYNAFPVEGAHALAEFMESFAHRHR